VVGCGRTKEKLVHKVPIVAIIDDDESVRLAIKSLVMSLGFAAHTFASAEEFLHSSLLNDASCLVADVQLSGISGIDLQRHLVSQGRRTPIIFITAFPDAKVRARALSCGAIDFLAKPFDGKVLVECLQTALRQNRVTR
jgi:FixJ family two-component response regulator